MWTFHAHMDHWFGNVITAEAMASQLGRNIPTIYIFPG